jgi:light-regulated signal transduction histidine kinase (bacteriophytochrome)
MQAFSYSISHDLRAPLRSVSGFATILINEHGADLPPDAVNKLKNIRESGQRMGRLIDGLLDYLRSGDGQFTRQIVDPAKIVRVVMDRFASQLADRQVEFVVGELPSCIANVRMLERVYEELLGNAIKFTRIREKARIEIGSYPENNRTVYFVKDNGAGFNMKYYDKLFGVFQRLHHENEFEGSGANLAIVNRILQRLGGRIWAEAEVDKGATFFFML